MVMDFVNRTALLPLMDDAFSISPTASALPTLAYSEDIAILANSFEGSQRMVSSIVSVASSVGLRLNFSKTGVLAFCSQPTPTPPLPSFPAIKVSSNFKYLGFMANTRESFHGELVNLLTSFIQVQLMMQ